MTHPRILVVEDDPQWITTIRQVLEPVAEVIAEATTLAEADVLLQKRYFNVAIVDVSLRPGDPKDDQGMEFLQLLRKRNLETVISPIILSAYGSVQRTRRAFREFRVVDFLEKASFDEQELLSAVRRAMIERHLDREVKIELAAEGNLDNLWGRFNWPQREDAAELRPELVDVLCSLFPGATELSARELPAGQSGATVLRVEPYHGANTAIPALVKLGKRQKAQREHDNYVKYIHNFVGSQSSTQLGYASGRVMGAIRYRLVGTDLGEAMSFADYYQQHSVEQICQALDHLFREACGRWYDNREQPRRLRNLIELYEAGLRIKWGDEEGQYDRWPEIWQGMSRVGMDPERIRLQFPGVAGSFANPKRWLDQRRYSFLHAVWRCVTHGDLNPHNVLVTRDGDCWLIDFYRTGVGHILRDLIQLETGIKFELAAIGDLADYWRFEQVLAGQQRIDRPIRPAPDDPHHKPLAVIAHLRRYADNLSGRNHDMAEYNVGLLLTTLNLLRHEFLREKYQQIALSAAMMAERLDSQ